MKAITLLTALSLLLTSCAYNVRQRASAEAFNTNYHEHLYLKHHGYKFYTRKRTAKDSI